MMGPLDNLTDQPLSVSGCISLLNEVLEAAAPALMVEGEVASFKINQYKYVFFDLKDSEGTLGCFMMAHQLRVPLEDGMRVRVVAVPRITPWGKFSLTVKVVVPVGAGSLARAYQLLKQRLEKEGLFAAERKRPLPEYPERIAVISSRQAAGFADFMKIAAARWPLADITVEHVRVQGVGAADDIIAALETINSAAHPPEAIALVRGGGSADDLACFNDEPLVRAIAASRVPVIAGIGHEVDETLASLAADRTASTPSNAAELLLPDQAQVRQYLRSGGKAMQDAAGGLLRGHRTDLKREGEALDEAIRRLLRHHHDVLERARLLLRQLDPATVLARGYAIVRAEGRALRDATTLQPGTIIQTQLKDHLIESEVRHVKANRSR
ncbi:exodeoxyribonuclease VII large subunit [Candidatus Saccharibacteria bacterium]|nr:exodeoxyribonuclease VII large subunit [Candidatus Saccharibacteria bacterium]